jgi:mannose-6-phosphate isomerase-like protein (cupin superfamily)
MQSPKTYREKRPWGEFVEFVRNTPTTVKIITINPGEALSLQKHKNRDEFWRVISGMGTITIGQELFPAEKDGEYFVPRNVNHRAEGGDEPLVILEISFGDFEEQDIVRIEDKYGRSGSR